MHKFQYEVNMTSISQGLDEKELINYPILILIPVFNDWEALAILLMQLDKVLHDWAIKADILVVDDASTKRMSSIGTLIPSTPQNINQIDILELRRNLGHQRAIAIGLAYIEAHVNCQAVVIMDGDGEDNPMDILRLIEKYNQECQTKIVFARRNKRSEGQAFKTLYNFYRIIYKILTGHDIRFGNFSIIPYQILQRVVVVSEIWNHYASGVLKARLPYTEISTNRSHRLAGKPQMNLVSLVTHGLSSISVYGDIVGTRLLISTFSITLSSFIAILTVVIVRLTTDLAIPGWASYMVGIFFIIMMQTVMFSIIFCFIVLGSRNNFSFLPNRDYDYFVLKVQRIFSRQFPRL